MCSKNRRDEELIKAADKEPDWKKLYKKALDVLEKVDDGCPLDFGLNYHDCSGVKDPDCRQCFDNAIRESVKGGE